MASSSASRPKFRSYYDGDDLYSTFGYLSAVPTPPVESTITAQTPPEEFTRRRWFSASYPYLAFIPATSRFTGLLCSRLMVSEGALKIRRQPSGWMLDLTVANEWLSLEALLKFIASALFEALPPRRRPPPTVSFLPFPTSYGYTHPHPTEDIARSAVQKAKNAFIPLMAVVSFAMAMHCNFKDLTSSCPPWSSLLQQNYGCHPAWLDALRNSTIGDFSSDNPRTGVFLAASDPASVPSQPAFMNAKVPIWVHCGTRTSRLTPIPSLAVFVESITSSAPVPQGPSRQKFTQADTLPTSAPADAASPNINSRNVPAEHIPKSLPNSGQRDGEHIDAYFLRHRIKHQKIEAAESPSDRSKRLAREQAQATHPVPGRKGPPVFEWEVDLDDPHETGWLLRTPVSRSEVQDAWTRFSRSQRRYDSFCHQWDLCESWDAKGVSDDMLEDHEMQEDQDEAMAAGITRVQTPPPPPSDPPALTPIYNGQSLPTPEWNHWSRDLLSQLSVAQDANISDLEDVNVWENTNQSSADFLTNLYLRFGFAWSNSEAPSYEPVKDLLPAHKLPLKYHHPAAQIAANAIAPLSDFFQFMSQEGHAPLQLWDLHVDSADNPRHIVSPALCTTRWALPPRIAREVGSLLTNDPSTPYTDVWELAPQGNLEPSAYRLIVSATTAVQALREEWSGSVDAILKCLLDRGIPCQRLVPVPTLPPIVESTALPPISLESRPHGYTPDIADYAAYEARRNSLVLAMAPRLPATRGGIAWRLTYAYLKEEVENMSTLDLGHLFCESIHDSSGGAWKADSLSPDEINVICGVYHVGPAVGHGPPKEVSWWPKPGVWDGCGLNTGYWDAAAESWFTTRLHNIRAGSEQRLRTSDSWRHALRQHVEGVRFARSVNEASGRFLREWAQV